MSWSFYGSLTFAPVLEGNFKTFTERGTFLQKLSSPVLLGVGAPTWWTAITSVFN
jgi:hypothetical protein